MPLECRCGQSPGGTSRTFDAAIRSGLEEKGDRAGDRRLLGREDDGEDGRQRVGGGTIERIFKLRVAADRERFRPQAEFACPSLGTGGWSEEGIGKISNRRIGVVGRKLRFERGGQFGWDAAKQRDRGVGGRDEQFKRQAIRIRLVEYRQPLVGVLCPAHIIRRHTDREQHSGSIARTSIALSDCFSCRGQLGEVGDARRSSLEGRTELVSQMEAALYC